MTTFGYTNSDAGCAQAYILPILNEAVRQYAQGRHLRILEVGCGNGYVANILARQGHDVIGIDTAADGIAIAKTAFQGIRFECWSIYDEELATKLGTVDLVVAIEVIEHLMYPRDLFRQAARILRKDGLLILTTPYHGYIKNLLLSIGNTWDRHFGVDWDGGHIKFFSPRTLVAMAEGNGFCESAWLGLGRVPWVWKSMLLKARRRKGISPKS